MYHHCVYCAADLGANEALEEFPVGRRLAYDGAKGRLWVVCRRCERWNLSPLEERWEALEALERSYRDTTARVSTENISLARLAEGLEVVRVGAPKRPEFAAWRYGDQFGRRRKKFLIGTALGLGVGGAFAYGSLAVAGVTALMLPVHFFNIGRLVWMKTRSGTVLHDGTGARIPLDQEAVGSQKVRPSDEHPGGWYLDLGLAATEEVPILTGQAAVQALAVMLPRINRAGAGQSQIRTAVGALEDAGAPEKYFAAVEHHARRRGWGYSTVRQLPRELRLALEMAANEAQERTAAEGELALLERAWREAEELAAIADDLLIPDAVRGALSRLKTGA